MITIKGNPDHFNVNSNESQFKFAGREWSDSIRESLNRIVSVYEREAFLDMGNIDFISMFEWVSILAVIDKVLSSGFTNSLDINFLSVTPNYVPKPNEYIGILNNEDKYDYIHMSYEEFKDIDRLYKLTGFLESLGTLRVLNRPENIGQARYQWLSDEEANTKAFYSLKGNNEKHTTVLGLTLVKSKEHCKLFLDDEQIRNWREAMGDRFRKSTLFRSDEVWRVIFHELSVNIWEHSGASGFISSRIILPYNGQEVNYVWQHIFSDITDEIWPIFKEGLLEICVSDAGVGIVNTLRKAYEQLREKLTDYENIDIKDEDILAFSFDEIGTCKEQKNSWVTERHALGRTLAIISKYGGALAIRSGNAEISYITKGGFFERLPHHCGYKPTYLRNLSSATLGTQIQILLPLYPNINTDRNNARKSILECSLPSTFTTESSHPRGHLIPLSEAIVGSNDSIGGEGAIFFKEKCEELSKNIIETRPAYEPIVFDFGGINWTAAQFETFLYYFQNIIQNRPTLIIEISRKLANEIKEFEYENSITTLDPNLIKQKSGNLPSNYFDELSEKRFLETYKSVYSILLGLDEDGLKHIFALPSIIYEEPLISLIESPNTIENLSENKKWKNKINKIDLKLILHNINTLFQVDENNIWRCAWREEELYVEMNRVMSRHFDQIATRTGAWKASYLKEKSKENTKYEDELTGAPIRFNLSWQKEWRKDFLESSQILSRERYADEAAQRLIFRLQCGLKKIGKTLQNIQVLACPTGPAMLLATALHRWWPEEKKPIVADMSYYTLLSGSGRPPKMLLEGDVAIVQDILDKGTISGKLINAFRHTNANVICIIGLIRLVDAGNLKTNSTRITHIFEGWELTEEDKINKKIPSHAMIEVDGPEKCAPLAEHQSDQNSFWVEPRALYPIKYTSLRREFAPGHNSDLDRRNSYFAIFDSPLTGCLFSSGHYVYGQRHYAVAVNVRETLNGQIGNLIANWLANVCLGNFKRNAVPWENEESKKLSGSVTAVLMPLHSQIHYLWPKVSNILAQCGRRQPVWLLDATLFTGSGAAYRLPAQLINQIETAVKDSFSKHDDVDTSKFRPLRLLILDDAITSGRTAETIIGAITRLINYTMDNFIEKNKVKISKNDCRKPIEWIRYFSIFSQLGYARHLLWKNIKQLDGIPFTIEEFAPFMGVPVYDEKSCPICRDRRRLRRLISKCDQLGAIHASNWANEYLKKTIRIAIDSPWGNGNKPEYFESGIDILGIRTKDEPGSITIPQHSETAIWRFYECMYLSYPIGDFLLQIEKSWKPVGDFSICSSSFPESYRWSVLEWCLRNWARVDAATAKESFLACCIKELDNNTDLLETLLESSTEYYSDDIIKLFVKECIVRFAIAEQDYYNDIKNESAVLYLERLEIGLTAFFLNIPKHALDETFSPEDSYLLDEIYGQSLQLKKIGPSFIRNLHARLKRPRLNARPDWALNVIAESLLRGRDPDAKEKNSHHLLPGLIGRVLSSCRHGDWLLLQGSISLFLAALDSLVPYTLLDVSLDKEGGHAETIKEQCISLMEWYRDFPAYEDAQKNIPQSLSRLDDSLSFDGAFIRKFHDIFHAQLNMYNIILDERRNDVDKNNLLQFSFVADFEIKNCRCLAPVQRLSMCLANLAIDHIRNCDRSHMSRIICYREVVNFETEKIIFKILTNFADPEQTTNALSSSGKAGVERNILTNFGVVFDNKWSTPNQEEIAEGFLSTYKITTPSGYLPRSI